MPAFTADRIRNVALLGHSGAGKTTLTEALLHVAGVTSRMGRVEDGSTVSDWEPEEARRVASIQTSVIPVVCDGVKLNLLDTPGYDDFQGEVLNALQVADSAVILVSSTAGVESGAERAWRLCEDRLLPRLVVVSRMDRDNADFDRTVAQVQAAFGRRCVPVQLPVGAGASLSCVIDLVHLPDDVPDEVRDAVAAARDQLVEAVAETDDDLATKFLEEGDLTQDEMVSTLHRAIAEDALVPVLAVGSLSQVGLLELVREMTELLPSPAERGAVRAHVKGDPATEVPLAPDPAAPLAAYVFKTAADPFVGRLNYFRVLQGVFKGPGEAFNVTRGEAERVGQLFTVRGKHQEPVPELCAGDIGAVAKLQHTATHDVLGARDLNAAIDPPRYPAPTFLMAVTARTKADVEKMSAALTRAVEEDSGLRLTRHQDTGEVVLAGLGETHLEMTVERIKRKFGCDLVLQPPRIAYKEAVTAAARAEYKHKKQTGGHGQYGHVHIRVEPGAPGSGFTFGSEVVGGAVPKEYISSVEKGAVRAVHEGVLAGCPVVDVRAVVVDGSSHPVDSSGVSFEIAGYYAFKKAFQAASPALLEPIMHLQVKAPDQYSGAIMGDLNGKRGRILGTNPDDGVTVIDAEVPQAELLRYATELRSLTQGRGTFTMELSRYEQVPPHQAQRVIDASGKREAVAV